MLRVCLLIINDVSAETVKKSRKTTSKAYSPSIVGAFLEVIE